jgi:hypothetical protein
MPMPSRTRAARRRRPAPAGGSNDLKGRLYEENPWCCHAVYLDGVFGRRIGASLGCPEAIAGLDAESERRKAAVRKELCVLPWRRSEWKFGDMPPVPGVTPDDVAHITAYVRMHQRKAGIR